MLVILFAASCILAVSSQQMPLTPFTGRVQISPGRFLDLSTLATPTLESVCNAAVMMNGGRVTDALSDSMGQAVSTIMKNPAFRANPLAMGGASAKWQCLIQANAGNTAAGISDYFDTVPELRRYIPGFNPCQTVFCGEQNMTPGNIIRELVTAFSRASMGMGPAVPQHLLSLFGSQRNKIPSRFTSPRGGMGGMGTMGGNPFMAALGRMGGMGGSAGAMGGGGGAMGGGGGLAGMMKMAQQVMGGMANRGGMMNPFATQTQPLNTAQPSSVNSAAATNTNPSPNPTPAQTGVSAAANNAASLPASSSSSSSSSPSATPTNPSSSPLSPKAITGNPFAMMPTPGTMNRMMQQMQQLKTQLMGVSMGGNTPKKPAVSTGNTGTGTGMPNMGMTVPGMGMTGMPGMSMPNMGMGTPGMGMGMPGMGSLANVMQLAMMGEMMADAPDPVQRPAMGMQGGMMGRGMPGMFGNMFPQMGGAMPMMGGATGMPMMGGSTGFPFGMQGTGGMAATSG